MNNKLNKTFYKDTFSFDLEGNRKFQPGDKVIVGIAKSTYSDEDVIPLKIINITEEKESLMNIINNLYDIATAGVQPQKLQLGSTNLAKLTDEEKVIATNKGWSLS